MDKEQFARFAMALKTYYPKETLLPNQQAMELWHNQLSDISYEVAQVVLNKWVAVNKWAPTIADIREQAANIITGEIPDWGEGWEQVLKAIGKYGMYRQQEALNSLDEITRKCVERLGFMNICISENISADRANFRTLYETLAERQKRDMQIPETTKVLIQQIKGGMIEQKADGGLNDKSRKEGDPAIH